ncbi:MAG: helix-turn-helix domain-containing protein, partial [Nitrosospira sp.]|nr:helix-turn-helix domain-containing protein [Nitrosospira sp.]
MRRNARFSVVSSRPRVALEALRGVKTVNEIAQECGVHPTQVGLWKKELQEQASFLFD